MMREDSAQVPNLEALMERYQQADAQATRDLIAAISPTLFRFFASQLGDRNQAEDMLQDAWLRIHRVRHTYRPGEPVMPWVFAIARRVRIDSFRKRRRIQDHERTTETLPEKPQPQPRQDDLYPELEAILAELPASQREVLTLMKVNGLSLEEVARATSSTVGAVKQKAHRAYERLRSVLSARKESRA
jgi:RNA polymerase sigma-70 factor (ECF subfamily)